MKKVIAAALVSLFAASVGLADTIINEKFAADPSLDGWQIFGDPDLFQWDSTNQVMDVTWDSSQTNSYFYHPLARTFTQADGFCVQFDLNLKDTDAVGYYQLAVGLCNYTEATSAGFSRANFNSPDLCEFDYYPDGPESYGPSIDATLIDSDSGLSFAFDDTQPMPTGTDYRIVLIHRAGDASISATVYTNGQVFSALPVFYAGNATNGFNLDTLAICNYTTLDDFYGDSLLVHGTVGNLSFASPLPIGLTQFPAVGQIQFASDTNWLYTLEQTPDFQSWSPVAPTVFGNGTNLLLQATNLPVDKSFYQVRADLP